MMTPIMSRRQTLKDLAKACGISVMAASYAMRNSPEVSEELRAKVQAMAAQIGYIPSSSGRRLRGGRVAKIGVVLSMPDHPVAMRNLAAIDAACRERGYQAEPRFHYWNRELEQQVLTGLLEEGVAGLMLSPSSVDSVVTLEQLDQQGLVPPFIGLAPLGERAHALKSYRGSITPNAEATGELVLEHLAMLGHERVAFVFQSVPSNGSALPEMAQGFHRASQQMNGLDLQLFNLAPSSSPVQKRVADRGLCSLDDFIETDRLLARYFLDHMSDVSAVVASDDLSAICLYGECIQRGIRVPHDLSLMSLGGSPVCNLAPAPLSHASVPMDQIARALLGRLLDESGEGAQDYSCRLMIVNAETLSDRRGGRESVPAGQNTSLSNHPIRLLSKHPSL